MSSIWSSQPTRLKHTDTLSVVNSRVSHFVLVKDIERQFTAVSNTMHRPLYHFSFESLRATVFKTDLRGYKCKTHILTWNDYSSDGCWRLELRTESWNPFYPVRGINASWNTCVCISQHAKVINHILKHGCNTQYVSAVFLSIMTTFPWGTAFTQQ